MDQDLTLLVGRIDGKMDMLLEGLKKHLEDDDNRFTHANERIDDVEKKVGRLKSRWAFAAGCAAVVTFLISNYSLFQGILGMLPK